MNTRTPHAHLNVIDFDQDPWDEDTNENTRIIDSLLGQFITIPNFQGLWRNNTSYLIGQQVADPNDGSQWACTFAHLSAPSPATFASDRAAHPSYWAAAGVSAASSAAAASISANQAAVGASTATGQALIATNQATNATTQATAAAASAASAHTDAAATLAVQTNNTGRNVFRNALMRVRQRGNGPWTIDGIYTIDGWQLAFVEGTMNVDAIALTDSDRTNIGEEEFTECIRIITVGNAGINSFNAIVHKSENVRRLAHKTVSLSFWAVAPSGAPKLGVRLGQHFGSGGAPSAPINTVASQFVLTSSWVRYTATVDIPSIAGKTIGTAGDDANFLEFFTSAGSNVSPVVGNVGVQSSTIFITGVSVERGPIANPIESLDPANELLQCQRYYQTDSWFMEGNNAAGTIVQALFPLKGTMRAVPTVVNVGPIYTNCTLNSFTAFGLRGQGIRVVVTVSTSGAWSASGSFTASAEL